MKCCISIIINIFNIKTTLPINKQSDTKKAITTKTYYNILNNYLN